MLAWYLQKIGFVSSIDSFSPVILRFILNSTNCTIKLENKLICWKNKNIFNPFKSIIWTGKASLINVKSCAPWQLLPSTSWKYHTSSSRLYSSYFLLFSLAHHIESLAQVIFSLQSKNYLLLTFEYIFLLIYWQDFDWISICIFYLFYSKVQFIFYSHFFQLIYLQ